jgi:hypothetical protein
MSGKITAEKLLEDRRGIDALLKEVEHLKLDEADVCPARDDRIYHRIYSAFEILFPCTSRGPALYRMTTFSMWQGQLKL